MSVVNSFFTALSMYSAIPAPQVEWSNENRKYALCFFPFIGVIIGAAVMCWYFICRLLNANNLIFAAVASALPPLVTGGIHLDGFCDTSDALASHTDRGKMLEIMKDPHIGAFAAIKLALYLLVQTALFSQTGDVNIMLICALGFVQSRAWSALGAVFFKNAYHGGTLRSFGRAAHKRAAAAASVIILAITSASMIFADHICGAAAVIGGVCAFIYYKRLAYAKFGGVTGDTAGYFLQICELWIMIFTVFASLITGVIA